VVSNCVLTVNAAGRNGGGVYGGTLVGCTLIRNQADLNGGGAFASLMNNSLIISNHASSGGGASYGTLNNCLVLTNSAGGGGGVCRADMNNCTVVGNTANTAGGVYLAPDAAITNCIVYYNTGGGFPNYAQGYTSNSLSYCCTTPMPALPSSGFGNITNAPLFVNPVTGDFHLQSGSPCINAGLNIALAGNQDFGGSPRIAGGTVDAGAYEFQSPGSVLSYAWLQQYGLPMDGSADYADGDGDGVNNWSEWRAGTDPTDASSLLRMLAAGTNPSGITVSWQSVTNRSYFLERATDLSSPAVFQSVQDNLAGQPGTTSYTDTNAVGTGPFFYRVGVQQ
jgi:hypothetical protein